MESEAQILFDVTLMMVIAGITSIIFSRLRFPSIIGYLVAGAILGPYVPTGVIIGDTVVSSFATIGLVLLMFYIGLELNLRGFRRIASFALVVAAVEMIMMVIIGYVLGLLLRLDPIQAIVLGIVISAASTAVVIGTIRDRLHLDHNTYRTITGILIMEDIGLIIGLAALTSVIAGSGTSIAGLAIVLVEVFLFFGVSIILGVLFVPVVLDRVAKRYSGETLSIVSLGLAFAMALFSSSLGLSIAIGPFLMGIIISQALCCSTVVNKVEPMKELFMAVFFISIGYQLDPRLLIASASVALTIAAVFIVGKLASVMTGLFVANYSLKSSFLVASSLVVIGEFSFIIAQVALDGGVINNSIYSAIIGASVVTMILLPLISSSAPKVIDLMARKAPRTLVSRISRMEALREEARKKMARSEVTRRGVKRQLLMIFCDFILIATILLGVNIIIASTALASEVAASTRTIPQVLLFVASVALSSPAIFNAIHRIRIIALFLSDVRSIERRIRNRAYRVFRNIGEIILSTLILLVFIPFMPRIEGVPPLALLGLLAFSLVVGYLIWDTFKATYNRISGSLGRGVMDSDEALEEQS